MTRIQFVLCRTAISSSKIIKVILDNAYCLVKWLFSNFNVHYDDDKY